MIGLFDIHQTNQVNYDNDCHDDSTVNIVLLLLLLLLLLLQWYGDKLRNTVKFTAHT